MKVFVANENGESQPVVGIYFTYNVVLTLFYQNA